MWPKYATTLNTARKKIQLAWFSLAGTSALGGGCLICSSSKTALAGTLYKSVWHHFFRALFSTFCLFLQLNKKKHIPAHPQWFSDIHTEALMFVFFCIQLKSFSTQHFIRIQIYWKVLGQTHDVNFKIGQRHNN